MNSEEFQNYINSGLKKRAIKMPLMNIVRVLRYILFQCSSDHRKLKKLRGNYEGQRCFIVGNGPSLTIADLEALKGEHCFAFNRIYETFDKISWRPEIYMVLDNDVMKTVAKNFDKIEAEYKLLNIMGKTIGVKGDDKTTFFCSFGPYRIKEFNYVKKKISKDISKYISLNYSVTGAAIETAIYLGFKEIYFVGMDHNYSRYIDKNGIGHCDDSVTDYSLMNKHDFVYFIYKDALESCFKCYREYCEKNGIKIANATRGGQLEVFERVDFDSLIKEQ